MLFQLLLLYVETPGARKNARPYLEIYPALLINGPLADKSIFGVAERFFAELSENNQKLLVERAVTLYDGGLSKEPDDSDILVCKDAVHGSWKSKHG